MAILRDNWIVIAIAVAAVTAILALLGASGGYGGGCRSARWLG